MIRTGGSSLVDEAKRTDTETVGDSQSAAEASGSVGYGAGSADDGTSAAADDDTGAESSLSIENDNGKVSDDAGCCGTSI